MRILGDIIPLENYAKFLITLESTKKVISHNLAGMPKSPSVKNMYAASAVKLDQSWLAVIMMTKRRT